MRTASRMSISTARPPIASSASRVFKAMPRASVRSVTYLKAHAAEMIREAADTGGTWVITQNGEAKAVLQDVRVYEELQESLALLKVLAQSRKSVAAGRVRPWREAIARV